MFGENAERDARTENSGLSRPPPNTQLLPALVTLCFLGDKHRQQEEIHEDRQSGCREGKLEGRIKK